jgi:hypothetical protein
LVRQAPELVLRFGQNCIINDPVRTFTLKINESLDRWLMDEAARLGRTKSEIAREALERHRQGKSGRSVHDLMKDFCGSIKGGPRDMSRNMRKYMKGFGE